MAINEAHLLFSMLRFLLILWLLLFVISSLALAIARQAAPPSDPFAPYTFIRLGSYYNPSMCIGWPYSPGYCYSELTISPGRHITIATDGSRVTYISFGGLRERLGDIALRLGLPIRVLRARSFVNMTWPTSHAYVNVYRHRGAPINWFAPVYSVAFFIGP